jgi:hypothetical protein
MAQSNDSLQERLGRWTLILGVCQVTVGCLVGFIPPSAVPWFRGVVMSHIEYTANGVLMIAFGFLLKEMRLGSKGLWAWFASLQLGTWTNGTAGLVGGLLGYSSAMMPTINEKFPAPRGLDHPAVSGLLQLCGVTMMVALFLTLYGLCSRRLSRN